MSYPTADPTETRQLNRPPEEIWEQLTSPDGFEQWMGPGSTIDPEPGGELIAADPESGEPKVGRVLEVDPIRRLRWAWRPLGEDPDEGEATEVLVDLEPTTTPLPGSRNPGTIITVTERPSTHVVGPVAAWASASTPAVGSTPPLAFAGHSR